MLARLIVSGSAFAKNPDVGGAARFEEKNIIDNALNSKDHTTLVAAVKAAGLVVVLQGKGLFKVLVPTSEAFATLPAGTVESLLKPKNKDKLVKILTCHVIPAAPMAADVTKMAAADGGTHEVAIYGGCKLKLSVKDNMVMITNEIGGTAMVTIADVKQSNGVIQVIDHVLLPKL